MMIEHIHSTKEKPYGLFSLAVQPDFTIGRIVKINERHYKNVGAAAISSEDLLSYRTHD